MPHPSAREHADLVLQQVARMMRDRTVFANVTAANDADADAAADAGAGGSRDVDQYGSVAQVRNASSIICRLLFRVYAHVYHSHTPVVRRLGLQVSQLAA
jgi:hypothetical protein